MSTQEKNTQVILQKPVNPYIENIKSKLNAFIEKINEVKEIKKTISTFSAKELFINVMNELKNKSVQELIDQYAKDTSLNINKEQLTIIINSLASLHKLEEDLVQTMCNAFGIDKTQSSWLYVPLHKLFMTLMIGELPTSEEMKHIGQELINVITIAQLLDKIKAIPVVGPTLNGIIKSLEILNSTGEMLDVLIEGLRKLEIPESNLQILTELKTAIQKNPGSVLYGNIQRKIDH